MTITQMKIIHGREYHVSQHLQSGQLCTQPSKKSSQSVFVREMILNVKHVSNWEHIKQRKQALVNKNIKRENETRKPHTHKVGDKLLLKRETEYEHKAPCEGPHSIFKTHDKGTVRSLKGKISQGCDKSVYL